MSNPLQRKLNQWHGYALMIGGMIGSGLFVVTGEAGAKAGPAVPFGYVILLPIILCTALAYLVFLSSPLGDHAGGAYTHISRTFNNTFIGFIFMWFQYIALIGVVSVMGLSFGQFIAPEIPHVSSVMIATVLVLLFYFLNLIGVKWFGNIQLWMSIILLIAIVILVVPGLFSIDMSYYSPMLPFGWSGFYSILPSLFFSYFGFEQLAQAGAEMKDSRKSMPRTMIIGLLMTVCIYFLVAFVAFGHLPYGKLATSNHAMADVAALYLPSIGRWIVVLGIIMAFATTLNSVLMVTSRIIFSFSEDKIIPPFLARVNTKFGTPHIALTFNTILVLILLWTRTLDYVINISLQGMFIMYMGHAIALIVLPFIRPKLYEAANVKPPKTVLVIAGLISLIVLIAFSFQMIVSVYKLMIIWLFIGIILYAIEAWRKKSN